MTRQPRHLRTALAAAVLIGSFALGGTAASAQHGATVTTGGFQTLPGASDLGLDVRGWAGMVRLSARDTTRVRVHVRGLEPNTTYGAHVHAAPCAATPPGGGHYQHVVGGAVDPVNEIWPTITTNAAGVGRGTARHGHVAREEARAIVIHWPQDSSVRLACVDLD